MNEAWISIIILIVFILIGFLLYKATNRGFNNNAKIMMARLFREYDLIRNDLQNKEISEEDKEKMNKRKDEILNTLSQFYGYDLKQNIA